MSYGSLPATGYSGTAKLLHWLVALCVLTIIPVGFWMNMEGPYQNQLFNLHKSLGVLILGLMIVRIAYRLLAGAPAAEPGIARWQKAISSAVHGILYILLIGLPIAGYIANSAYGANGTPTPFFGLFELPPIVGPKEELSKSIFSVHKIVGWVVGGLVVLHIGGAMMHFLKGDGVMQRMIPKSFSGR